MEARSFSQEKSQQLMRKVKEYKADLKKITEDSRQAQGGASGTSAICNRLSHKLLSDLCLVITDKHVGRDCMIQHR